MFDPLNPIFEAYDWEAGHTDDKLVFLKEYDDCSFGCEVRGGMTEADDLWVSTAASLVLQLETSASDETILSRLGLLEECSVDFFRDEPLIKKMSTFWFKENKLAQISVSNIWVGHTYMLCSPYELYVASADKACYAQHAFLKRIESKLTEVLTQPDDSVWASVPETYGQIVTHPGQALAANSNRKPP
ncbi:MAG: hypothetical protein ACI92I_000099 [Acidimicrobiales bacterium]|jgi:hypothetical protein